MLLFRLVPLGKSLLEMRCLLLFELVCDDTAVGVAGAFVLFV